ncbi:MAG: energy-coupling factor ABC transporter permease [Nitrososphaerota archaeon]
MHIHIPDGILPIWLWGLGYILTFFFLVICLLGLKKEIKKIPLVGMLTAIALIIMSVPLGLPIHLNLMVLIGLLVGIRWSLVSALVLNFILASFGHGGITVVGLNTLVLWWQAVLGIFLFKFSIKIFKNYFASASFATFASLACSFLAIIGIVAVSRVEPAEFLHLHRAGREIEEIGHTELSFPTFILLSAPISFFGALVESIFTGFCVQFIKKIKPKLIAI